MAKYEWIIWKFFSTNRKNSQFLTIKNKLFTKQNKLEKVSNFKKLLKQLTALTAANNHSTTS